MKKDISEENPETFHELKLSAPSEVAGGKKAVVSSVKHVFNEMGAARATKALFQLNQFKGYDCPGCAWPDPDDDRSSLGEYCENGAKAIAEEATTKACNPAFFARNSIQEMSQWDDYTIGKSGRVTQPMYLPKGGDHYVPISWDDAFSKIANHLQNCSDPNEAIFYTSGRTSNEAAFLYQLFAKEFGTNNMPDCSNMCHESTGTALGQVLGIGKGSVTLEDLYEADVIMVMGQNPGTNHPRMLTAMQKNKKNGGKIISVNPLKETGLSAFANPQTVGGLLFDSNTKLADEHLQVRINGDQCLLQVMAKYLFMEDERLGGKVLDHDFIASHTSGFEEYKQHILSIDEQTLAKNTGIDIDEIHRVANLIRDNDKIIICWAMGLTQHRNSVDIIKDVVNLLLLKGSVGKPGAGTCPVRGHSNVQGDRTVGVFEKPWPALLKGIEDRYDFVPPKAHGYDVVQSIEAMEQGHVRVFMGMGGNFISATPDTRRTAAGLNNCKLTVQVSTKLNRGHLITGEEALILPTYGRSDKDIVNGELQLVTCENSVGVVQASRGVLDPISDHYVSEPHIVCRLALATLPESKVPWKHYMKHYDHIRDDIEKVLTGFDDYNARARQKGGFYLPNGARKGVFHTSTGKAKFSVSAPEMVQCASDEFIMMTIRSHDQYNTTIYGLDDRYRGIQNERRVVLVNKDDMEAAGLSQLEVVNITNSHGEHERIARNFKVIAYDIPRGCVATYFPEANVLVPLEHVARESNTPASKSVTVKIHPAS